MGAYKAALTLCNTNSVHHLAMKNITITVKDAASEWVRINAAKRNTRVSRWVGEMIVEKMRHADVYGRVMCEALCFEPNVFEGAYLKRDGIYADQLARLC